MKNFVPAAVLFLACVFTVVGQSKTVNSRDAPLTNPDEAVGCELARRFIDDAAFRGIEHADKNMFFIVRTGKSEFAANIAEVRIKQLKLMMLNHPQIKSVFAVGERTSRLALIEIYVDGKILYTLPLPKNKGIDMRECLAI